MSTIAASTAYIRLSMTTTSESVVAEIYHALWMRRFPKDERDGIRLARERRVNVRVEPTGKAIEESVELAHEIFNRVFRRVPGANSEDRG